MKTLCMLACSLVFAANALGADSPLVHPSPVTLGGIIHSDSDDTLAFTPDRNTVFFDRSSGQHKTIMVAHRVHGHWSAPRVASFSGHWFDQDPVVAPDGSYLLFDSNRPVRPGGPPLQQNYFVGGAGPGSNLWRVDRHGNRWGKPRWLSATINSDVFVDFASITADDTLYFMLFDSKAKVMHILRSEYRDGRYQAPQNAGIGTPSVSEHDPAVAPDQSFVVFDLGKTKGGLGRLCIAFREHGEWGQPIDLGDAVNKDVPWGSHLAPDGRTVYFTGQSGIWQLSLLPWLRQHADYPHEPAPLALTSRSRKLVRPTASCRDGARIREPRARAGLRPRVATRTRHARSQSRYRQTKGSGVMTTVGKRLQ